MNFTQLSSSVIAFFRESRLAQGLLVGCLAYFFTYEMTAIVSILVAIYCYYILSATTGGCMINGVWKPRAEYSSIVSFWQCHVRNPDRMIVMGIWGIIGFVVGNVISALVMSSVLWILTAFITMMLIHGIENSTYTQ